MAQFKVGDYVTVMPKPPVRVGGTDPGWVAQMAPFCGKSWVVEEVHGLESWVKLGGWWFSTDWVVLAPQAARATWRDEQLKEWNETERRIRERERRMFK